MPDLRTNPSVAERLDLHVDRIPNRLRRQRRWLTLAGGVVPLVVIAVMTWRGNHTMYMARPVATSHRPAQADCTSCHRTPWQPLVRLARLDNQVRSVHDQDCRQCHPQSKSDHNPFAMAQGVPDCVVCHQEHRGSERLTEDADGFCRKCHATFDQHPEFALHRGAPPDPQSSDSAAMMFRELLSIAEFRESTGDDRGARWFDRTALRFNHQEHLKPLHTVWNPRSDSTATPTTVQLQCGDCHQPDAAGAYMRPIVFEQHCQSCHPLRFSGKLSDQPLPHETPEIVRSVLRDRLLDYAREHPEEVLGVSQETNSRLPNKSSQPATKDIWSWVEQELRRIELAVFQTTSDAPAAPKNNACQKCHVTSSASAGIGFEIVAPNIPTRWLMHARFDHGQHRDVACLECHHGEPGATTLQSTTVQDILMPKLDVCQNCHGATRTRPDARFGRKNCVECHQYHHVSESTNTDAPSH